MRRSLLPNWEKAVAFYEALGFAVEIGWDLSETRRAAFLAARDGTYIEVFGVRGENAQDADLQNKGPLLHVCFRSNDVEASFVAAKDAGASVVTEPTHVTLAPTTGTGTDPRSRVLLEGPTGEVIEVVQGLPRAGSRAAR